MDTFRHKIVLNCGFFLALWWGYYFILKIPYFLVKEIYDYDDVVSTLTIVLIFFICFYIGLVFKPYRFKFFTGRMDGVTITNSDLIKLCIITIALNAVYNFYQYGTLNFIESIKNLSERRENTEWGGSGIYIYYFLIALIKSLAIVCLAFLMSRKKYITSFVFLIIIFLLALQAGSKYALVWFFYPLAIYSFQVKKLNLLKIIVPLLLVVISIPLINIFRNRKELDLTLNDIDFMLDVLLKRADLFNGLYLMIEHVHKKGYYELGLTLYALFTRFIPRDFLPDRLGSTDTYMTNEIYHTSSWVFNYGGIGEFYFNFGFIGVAVIGLISGYIVKSINYTLNYSTNRNLLLFALIIASPFWSVAWGIGINNLFTTLFVFWFITIPFVIGLFKISKRIKF